MLFIGDVHGKTDTMVQLLNKYHKDKPAFQLGDMGLGFLGVSLPALGPTFHFIRGNHDDPAVCQKHPNYAGEWGWLKDGDRKLFFLGGAWSIDWGWRQVWNSAHAPKKVWWNDEELSQEQLDAAVKAYMEEKPDIVATHEAPTAAARWILSDGFRPEKAECANTRTSQALQRMFDAHQPGHWVFGHYHRTCHFQLAKDNAILPTKFHCLTELEMLEF